MNEARAIDSMHVNHHTMTERTFLISFLDGLRESCRECSVSLFGVNAAIASGKAVDLLRQRLIGRYGISDLRVDPIGRECGRPTIDIQIQTHEPVTDHARRLIEYEIRLVDERYGTNIHPMYSSRSQHPGEHDTGQTVRSCSILVARDNRNFPLDSRDRQMRTLVRVQYREKGTPTQAAPSQNRSIDRRQTMI